MTLYKILYLIHVSFSKYRHQIDYSHQWCCKSLLVNLSSDFLLKYYLLGFPLLLYLSFCLKLFFGILLALFLFLGLPVLLFPCFWNFWFFTGLVPKPWFPCFCPFPNLCFFFSFCSFFIPRLAVIPLNAKAFVLPFLTSLDKPKKHCKKQRHRKKWLTL